LREGELMLVMTGTTLGDVIIWDVSSFALIPMVKYQAHAIGTNSISVTVQQDDGPTGISAASIFICSGGDDQAACMAQVAVDVDGSVYLNQVCKQEGASYSAIKSVYMFSLRSRLTESDSGLGLVSVGCDQRLHVWRLLRAPAVEGDKWFSPVAVARDTLKAAPTLIGTFMRWLGHYGGSAVDVNDVMSMAHTSGCIEGANRLLLAVCGDGIEIISCHLEGGARSNMLKYEELK